MAQATIKRVEEYDEEGNTVSKRWMVFYKGEEYGPFYSYDDASQKRYELTT